MKKAAKPKSKHPKAARHRVKSERLTIGLAGFEKISAIEGLYLTSDMKKAFGVFDRDGASDAQRRAAIIKKYG